VDILPGGLRVEFLLKTTIVAIYIAGGEVKNFGFITTKKQKNKQQTNSLRVANPRGEAFLCGPKGGFWPNDFSKKNSSLGSI